MMTQQTVISWWQRPQPAWLTTLISMVGMALILGVWNLGQTSFASEAEGDVQAVNNPAATVNYQGFVTNASGNPLNGNQSFTFRLFSASSGGTALLTESHPDVPVNQGLFNVLLGSKTSGGIPSSLWENSLYLETEVNGELLSPREKLQLGVHAPNWVQLQSGRFDGSSSTTGWTLHEGSGWRTYNTRINFDTPFAVAPKVLTNLSALDTRHDANVRIHIVASNITTTGFDLSIVTWADTHIYSASVAWLAYTE